MNGAQRVVDAILREEIDVVFGYPGGAIMPVYDALIDSGLRHVLVRHEQAALHAAQGYALASGKPGVCLVTSGPGVTNTVTGLADALFDSVPVVLISGQVPSGLLGTDAFQEVNAFSLTMPVVKHSFLLRDPATLDESLWRAFRIATSGRKGPVHLDLPKDVALAECPAALVLADDVSEGASAPSFDAGALERASELIAAARRPLIYAGGGIHQAGAVAEFRRLAEHLRIPVVSTLKGLGCLPSGHPMLLGMMGMHGSSRANRALADCDLLLVLGARFDDRATGKLETFCPDARVIHLDVDASEIGKLRPPEVAVAGCLSRTIPGLHEVARPGRQWDYGPPEPPTPWTGIGPCPRDLLAPIQADVVATDVGQHQMWAAQFLKLDERTKLITSGGLGTMGFGLPAAVGAQIARPEDRVVCVTGDGSLMMMIQELATVRRYRLPIKIVLFDNHCLGMVRQWQELFCDNRESGIDLSDNPDFVKVAAAFGIPGCRVERGDEVPEALERTMSAEGPFLLHAVLERGANVWPLVPPGKANHEMITESYDGANTSASRR